jgi:hypothetical protein
MPLADPHRPSQHKLTVCTFRIQTHSSFPLYDSARFLVHHAMDFVQQAVVTARASLTL